MVDFKAGDIVRFKDNKEDQHHRRALFGDKMEFEISEVATRNDGKRIAFIRGAPRGEASGCWRLEHVGGPW